MLWRLRDTIRWSVIAAPPRLMAYRALPISMLSAQNSASTGVSSRPLMQRRSSIAMRCRHAMPVRFWSHYRIQRYTGSFSHRKTSIAPSPRCSATASPPTRCQSRRTAPLRADRFPSRGEEGYEDYSKLDVEEAVLAAGATVLRLPMVYGPFDYQRREEFVLKRVRAGRLRIPVGAANALLPIALVDDVGRGVVAAVEHRARGATIYNLARPYRSDGRVDAANSGGR
jgi:hypothetical protein